MIGSPNFLRRQGSLELRIFITLFLALFALTPRQVSAQHPTHSSGLKILGFPKEGRMEEDGTGHYADLVRAILFEAGYVDQLVTVPVNRAMRLFETDPNLCSVPVAKPSILLHHTGLRATDLVQSAPIDYVSGHIITRAGTKPITSPSELEGKVVGSWAGVDIRYFLPEVSFTLLRTESEISTIRMLQTKRVEAIWGWIPDVYILSERMGIEGLVFDPESEMLGSSTHFVCRRSPEAELFIQRISEVINTMRADGRLKKILGKHARVLGVDVPMSKANKPD